MARVKRGVTAHHRHKRLLNVIGILAGTVAGGALIIGSAGPVTVSAAAICVSLGGIFSAFRIPRALAAQPVSLLPVPLRALTAFRPLEEVVSQIRNCSHLRCTSPVHH